MAGAGVEGELTQEVFNIVYRKRSKKMFPEIGCLNVMQVLAQLREQFFSSEKNRLALNVCSRFSPLFSAANMTVTSFYSPYELTNVNGSS